MPTLINNAGNKFDALERMIFSNNLRIKRVDIRPTLNIMNITLNTGFVIRTNISSFPSSRKAFKAKILNYKLIGNGTGSHYLTVHHLLLKQYLILP